MMEMDKDLRVKLRAEGQRIDASVHIGRGGISEGVLTELDAQLKRNHLVKVRLQRGAVGGQREAEDEIAEKLAKELRAEIVERRGHTLLLYRRKSPPRK